MAEIEVGGYSESENGHGSNDSGIELLSTELLFGNKTYVCKRCSKQVGQKFNYCPRCGADELGFRDRLMDRPKEEPVETQIWDSLPGDLLKVVGIIAAVSIGIALFIWIIVAMFA